MEHISIFVSILFAFATFYAVWQFFKASGKSILVLIVLIGWMLLQTILCLIDFYQDQQAIPPRFAILIGPAILFIIILFITRKGKRFVDSLDIRHLTLLHSVRVPVEITLYFLFLANLVPVLMTFEGYNYDILSGLSAPIIYYAVFVIKKANRKVLLVWNFVCLGLLLNIVTIAILSAQTPFQKLAFDQPNIGVMYFPFVWLPSVVVPLVLLSHLVTIRQIVRSQE